MEIRFEGVSVDIGSVGIVTEVSMEVRTGEIAGLIGPNGSGKSTLLRTLYRHLRPAGGAVLTDGDDLWKLSNREASRRVAAVPQERPTEFDFTAREMVEMGRIPHGGLFASKSAEADTIVEAAIDRVGVGGFADRPFATLSGGERQRVLVARALAQDTPLLVLDEPTNHLDIRHQLELLDLLRELRLTTVIAIHDLNLAAAYCDTVHVLDGGRLVASGPTADVLTPDLISNVFGVDCDANCDGDGVLRLAFRTRRG